MEPGRPARGARARGAIRSLRVGPAGADPEADRRRPRVDGRARPADRGRRARQVARGARAACRRRTGDCLRRPATPGTTAGVIVVIGAGPAGLASAAMLQGAGARVVVLEQGTVGAAWTTRYDRLHLHTVRWL